MTKDEALTLALEALQVATTPLAKDRQEVLRAITAIKEALSSEAMTSSPNGEAQPEQRSVSEHLEPVAWPMEEQPDGSVIPIDPEEHPNFYTWTWDKFVSGGKWRAEYGWKKPEGFDFANLQPLYTTPPQRTAAEGEDTRRAWVGLTDEERNSLYAAHHNKYDLPNQGSPDGMDYERAIEAKLMEKNT